MPWKRGGGGDSQEFTSKECVCVDGGRGDNARTGREQKKEIEDPPTLTQGMRSGEEYCASPGEAEENAAKCRK